MCYMPIQLSPWTCHFLMNCPYFHLFLNSLLNLYMVWQIFFCLGWISCALVCLHVPSQLTFFNQKFRYAYHFFFFPFIASVAKIYNFFLHSGFVTKICRSSNISIVYALAFGEIEWLLLSHSNILFSRTLCPALRAAFETYMLEDSNRIERVHQFLTSEHHRSAPTKQLRRNASIDILRPDSFSFLYSFAKYKHGHFLYTYC